MLLLCFLKENDSAANHIKTFNQGLEPSMLTENADSD